MWFSNFCKSSQKHLKVNLGQFSGRRALLLLPAVGGAGRADVLGVQAGVSVHCLLKVHLCHRTATKREREIEREREREREGERARECKRKIGE